MINEQIQEIRDQFNKLKSERDFLVRSKESEQKKLEETQKQYETNLKAREILQIVAQEVQSNLEYKVSKLISLGLNSVFEDKYDFSMKFELKRGTTECQLGLIKLGESDEVINPVDTTGGGLNDLLSLLLRLSYWGLNKNRPVMILDEPLKHLSRDYHEIASFTIKQISKELGLQLIVISHSAEMISQADNVIEIK